MASISAVRSVRAYGLAASALFLFPAAGAFAQTIDWHGYGPDLRGGWNDAPPSLPERRPEYNGEGTVSVTRLGHKVPAGARKELERAMAAGAKGDSQAAIAHLEKALEIDPKYVDAYNDLGVLYLLQQRYEPAVEKFQQALAIDHNAAMAYSNLGIACIALRRFSEAEKAARSALKHDSAANTARYVLGLALDEQGREPREALESLGAAARQFPKARLTAARILARLGDRARAAAELRKYLISANAGEKPNVVRWLAKLED